MAKKMRRIRIGLASIQINVPDSYPNALSPNSARSSSLGTLFPFALLPQCCKPYLNNTNRAGPS